MIIRPHYDGKVMLQYTVIHIQQIAHPSDVLLRRILGLGDVALGLAADIWDWRFADDAMLSIALGKP